MFNQNLWLIQTYSKFKIELGKNQPVSFLNYITRNYNLYNTFGVKTNVGNVIGEDFINIVLRKKWNYIKVRHGYIEDMSYKRKQ